MTEQDGIFSDFSSRGYVPDFSLNCSHLTFEVLLYFASERTKGMRFKKASGIFTVLFTSFLYGSALRAVNTSVVDVQARTIISVETGEITPIDNVNEETFTKTTEADPAFFAEEFEPVQEAEITLSETELPETAEEESSVSVKAEPVQEPEFDAVSEDTVLYLLTPEADLYSEPTRDTVSEQEIAPGEEIKPVGYCEELGVYEVGVENTTVYLAEKDVTDDDSQIFEDAVGSKFAAADGAEIKDYPSEQGETVKVLAVNDTVELKGKNNDGYFEVEKDGETGYVLQSALSDTKSKVHNYTTEKDSSGNIVSLEWTNPADYCQWDHAGYFDDSEWNGDWGTLKAGKYTVGSSACVIASTVNVLSTMWNEKMDVGAISQNAAAKGHLNKDVLGAYVEDSVWLAEQYGFKTQLIQSAAEAKKALLEGKGIVALEDASPFYWGGGHAISLFGYKDGKTRVMDPNNPQRDPENSIGGQWHDLDWIWEYSQGPGQWVAIG